MQHMKIHGIMRGQLPDPELPEISGATIRREVAMLFLQLPFQGNLPTLKTTASTRRPGVKTSIMTANPTLLNGVGAFSGYCPFYYPTRKHSQAVLLTDTKTFHCSIVSYTNISPT
jgi:hypothetical protein